MKYLPILYFCLLLFATPDLKAQSDFETEITGKFFELPEVSQKAVLVFSERIHQQTQPYRRFPELADLLAREEYFTEQQLQRILLFLARRHRALSYATPDTILYSIEDACRILKGQKCKKHKH